MIPLLAEIARAERDSVLPATDEDERALRLLEWSRVLAQIAGGCLCRRAAAAVISRRPYVDRAPVELRRRLADELRVPGDRDEWPPLLEISDVLDWLEGPRPLSLEGPDLLQVAAAAAALDALADHFRRAPEEQPTWAAAAAAVGRFDHLAGAVRRVLDRDGRLRDDASPLLARLRRAAREREREVRAAAGHALAAASAAGLTTGDEVTLRGDRFCLPLRAAARRRVPGIVHDRSASGVTVYIEPAALVELHNDLAEIRLEQAAEETRLLFELNRAVEAAAPALVTAGRLLLLADETRAALLWSRRRRARRPELAEGAGLRLCAARHPLLEQTGEAEGTGAAPVVPLELELPADRNVLLVSGPNAGGKSVALKTVGVCVLLAQCGLDVPAREDTRLPLVRRLRVDLGDEQSIEMSLSSFSAHLGHLARFLADADARTLVLCDEICAGTDPEEGAALAFVALEGLAEQGAVVLASTHFGLLKAAAHDHPAMINAAMDFDEETLRPLFTLRLGVPGASHAFAIAGRCGLPPALLTRARARLGEERFRVERLLGELTTRARDMAGLEAAARASAGAAAERERDLARRLDGLARERAELIAATRRAGEDLLREGRRELEATVREIRAGGADAATVRRARDVLRDMAARLDEAAPRADNDGAGAVPRVGERVRIPHLGLTGIVLEVRGTKVVAEARGLRLTLAAADVEPLADGTAPLENDTAARAAWGQFSGGPAVQEIDLRGQRAEEAWAQLDLLIDRAIPGGAEEILVIHGIGSGRLREALLERLRGDPRVAGCEAAPAERGGAGATLVRLA